jgi:hypothetical protein
MSPAAAPVGAHLRSPLNRPEYVPVPEALIACLAWSEFEVRSAPAAGLYGLIYERLASAQGKVTFIETNPDLTADRRDAFGTSLLAAGLESEGDPAALAHAVAHGLRGLKAGRAAGRAASPLSVSCALLQDMRGMTGKESPYGLAATLEAMASMGVRPAGEPHGVAARWKRAAEARAAVDPLVGAVDAALRTCMPWGIVARDAPLDLPSAAAWGAHFPHSPFSWFRDSWWRLTDDRWVKALPARLWVDWALAVLRLVLGLGYLWEAAWYRRLVEVVLGVATGSSPPASWAELEGGTPDPLPWAPSSGSVALRSVTATLKPRLGTAHLVHGALGEWFADDRNRGAKDRPALDVIDEMAKDRGLVARLTSACKPDANASKNAWEAIRFTLGTRSESEGSVDYYGLLRAPSPRYLVVEPGIEWMAAMASLACGEPDRPATIANVAAFLSAAGLRPHGADLLQMLETAGLARGAADADQAVSVRPAF